MHLSDCKLSLAMHQRSNCVGVLGVKVTFQKSNIDQWTQVQCKHMTLLIVMVTSAQPYGVSVLASAKPVNNYDIALFTLLNNI